MYLLFYRTFGICVAFIYAFYTPDMVCDLGGFIWSCLCLHLKSMPCLVFIHLCRSFLFLMCTSLVFACVQTHRLLSMIKFLFLLGRFSNRCWQRIDLFFSSSTYGQHFDTIRNAINAFELCALCVSHFESLPNANANVVLIRFSRLTNELTTM